MVALADKRREEVIAEFEAEATAEAIAAGARRDSIQVIEIDQTPVPYLPDNNMRIRVRVAGELQL